MASALTVHSSPAALTLKVVCRSGMHGVTRSVQSSQEAAWFLAVLCQGTRTATNELQPVLPQAPPHVRRLPRRRPSRRFSSAIFRPVRAARRAPECAHALRAVHCQLLDRRPWRGFAARWQRQRSAGAKRSVGPRPR
jgi:hypothetical protein